MTIEKLLKGLWKQYTFLAPQAMEIQMLFQELENTKNIVNDHIALRTIKSDKIGINALSKSFIDRGYNIANCYNFENKHVNAIHLENMNADLPKIFISEIDSGKLSPLAQKVSKEIIAKSPEFSSPTDLYSLSHWKKKYSTYQELYKESEYLAWFYSFGFTANHFTVSVNHLKVLTDLDSINEIVKSKGFRTNPFGGEIKGSPEDLLEQSSTMAEKIPVRFSEGFFEVPSCFYEFAKRYPDTAGNIYQGFLAANADKIFESTKES